MGTLPTSEGGIQTRGAASQSYVLSWLILLLLLVGLGTALVIDPWLTVIAMLVVAVGIPSVWLLWRYPEFGLVLLVFLGSQILHPALLDLRLPIGGGLELPDLLLVGLASMLVLKQLKRGRAASPPKSILVAPILVLLGMAVFSTLRATMLLGVEVSWSFGELRGITYFLVLLIATRELTTRRQIKRLFVGLFLIGIGIVSIMIAQQFVGDIPLIAGQEAAGWQIIDVGGGNIIRIRPPGHLLIYYLSIVAFAMMGFSQNGRRRVAMLALALVLNLVMLLTFTRAQWMASVLAIAVCLVLIPRAARTGLITIALIAVFVGGAMLYATDFDISQRIEGDALLAPLADRITSMVSFEETLGSYSLETRRYQTEAALDSIAENPVLGVGLGNSYRGLTARESQSRYTRFTRFIENSYLYVATKMGLPSLIIFGWLIAAITLVGHRALKVAKDPTLRAIGVASFATMIGLFFWGFTHPVLFLPEHTLIVGLVGGVGEAIWRINR